MKYLRFSAFVAFFIILTSSSTFASFKDSPKGLLSILSGLLQSKSTNTKYNYFKSYINFWEERSSWGLLPLTIAVKARVKDGDPFSLGYHVQTNNKDDLLSMDFGLREFGPLGSKERLSHYRGFVYAKGGLTKQGEERKRGIELKAVERFRYRTRYFTDSGIIGTKDFVEQIYLQFKDHFASKHEKRPKDIKGLEGIFSLKRLSEVI